MTETSIFTVATFPRAAFPQVPILRTASSPLSDSTQQRRILAALGKSGGALPHVSLPWLERYYEYLAGALVLPFEARCPEGSGTLRPWTAAVSVIELLPPTERDIENETGILCRSLRGDSYESVELPLIELEVSPDHANAQLIEDHWYWFWNWRFDPRI